MNTISILISIIMPVVLITYISIDWFLSKKSESKGRVIYMSSDSIKIKQDHDSRQNDGEMVTNDEIIENVAYILDNYSDDI